MASNNVEAQERSRICKFTKVLTLKVAQIVIQSRQGNKVTHESNKRQPPDNDHGSSPTNLQWFNLSIPDEAEVESDTKQVLNGEVLAALSRVLCIEISLKTTDGDEMVLEMWTVRMTPVCESGTVTSVSTVYYRMGVMLKSTLSISRITPAYKIARTQNKESYKIYHKIYGGTPNTNLLGESYKTIKVSELRTTIGTIVIEVLYRTKMTILPDNAQKIEYQTKTTNEDILVNSDHFPVEIPRKNNNERKQIDLTKPLTAGAFVDVAKIKELHDTLSLQLPPEPPMSWLIAEKEKVENNSKLVSIPEKEDEVEPEGSDEACGGGGARAKSRAIEMPGSKHDKYSALMEFPFADGSPITELANFYQECLQARSASDEWTDAAAEGSVSTDSESLSRQLKMFEDAVPEFDNMVASMFSNSESGSDA